MSHLQQALAYGFQPKGYRLNLTETKILVQIDEVRSDAWTVSAVGKLPMEWLAMKADVSLRSAERAVADLSKAKVLVHDGGWVHIRATGRTRRWATYAINPTIIGTPTEWGEAEVYLKTVVHGMKSHAGQMYRLRTANPDWTMQRAWNELISDLPRFPCLPWCPVCHDPMKCRECKRRAVTT